MKDGNSEQICCCNRYSWDSTFNSDTIQTSDTFSDHVCLRQVPLATREEMLRGVAEGMMFSPRDPQLAAMHAGITASIAAI